jgi:hypothetical protein
MLGGHECDCARPRSRAVCPGARGADIGCISVRALANGEIRLPSRSR